jgi:hypothetical protein
MIPWRNVRPAIETRPDGLQITSRSFHSPDRDFEQYRNVPAHLRYHGCGSLRMELSSAARPIHALQLIDKHGPFNTPNGNRQTKRVRLHFAGQWTNYSQPACPVIAQIGQDQGGPALCLFPANLGIEIHENNISGVRNLRRHHSTISLPISAPNDTSAYRVSGVIWATI